MKKLFAGAMVVCITAMSLMAAAAASSNTTLPPSGSGAAVTLADTALDEMMYTTSAVGDGISINGFSASYLNSLNADQKQNLAIVIPAVYNGKNVVAIGDKAFYNITDCKFTSLDLSGAANLQTIGTYAFMSAITSPGAGPLVIPDGVKTIKLQAFAYCSGFSGDLILPDSIETMENSVFYECRGLNGTLHIPENPNFTTISEQLFYGPKLTGELKIPANITKIGKSAFRETSFSGTLTIPETVTSLGNAVFSGCNGFTGQLHIPDSITAIESQTFQGCSGLTGALVLSDSITSIGSQAFYGTQIQTVYLPNNPDTAFANSGSAFNSNSRLTAIVCPSADLYANFSAKITATTPKPLVCYPVTVSYSSSEGLQPLEKLYGRPINYVKNEQTGVWAADPSFALAAFPDSAATGYEKGWSFSQNGTAVKPADKVTGTTLYEVSSLAPPVITQSVSKIEKTYDGEPVYLEIKAEHPLEGKSVIFYYYWQRVGHYQNNGDTIWGKNNKIPVTNVDESAYADGDWYYVYVYAYDYSSGKPVQYYRSDMYYFYVNITPAASAVTPVLSRDTVAVGSDLPALALSADSTPGTITWDGGQAVTLGEKAYTWTFTPADSNYSTASGSINLTGVEQACYIKAYDPASQTISIISDKEQTGAVILAEYDAGNRLISCVVKQNTTLTAGENSVDMSSLGFSPAASSHCKAMIWTDLLHMVPLCEDKSI